jgi:hypothetical protein
MSAFLLLLLTDHSAEICKALEGLAGQQADERASADKRRRGRAA